MNSIRTRILIVLIPLVSLVILIVAGGIYLSVSRDLLAALDRTLLVSARGLEDAIGLEVGGKLEFDLEGASAEEFEDSEEAFYVIAHESGEPFVWSVPAAEVLLPDPGPEPFYTGLEYADNSYRVLTLLVVKEAEDDEEDRREWLEAHPGQALPDTEPMGFRITTGRSTEEVEEALAALGRRLFVGFGSLLVAIILLPTAVVSWALRPLGELSGQAGNVGPDHPNVRLQESQADREVRTLVRAFNQALNRLAVAYEQQRRFSADAAHELRTPITSIRTQCEVALRKPREAPQLRRSLKTVLNTVVRMGGMVERLLAFARFQDKAAIPMEPTELGHVVLEALRLNASCAHAKQVRLTVDESDGATTQGNEDLLVECVSSLVENAVRYTEPGGSVHLQAGNSEHPFVRVVDTGVGIPQEHLERIFERFYRVDRSRSRSDGGSGLGLSLAREIAHLHNGEIVVESREGEGSRFTLKLPKGPARERG